MRRTLTIPAAIVTALFGAVYLTVLVHYSVDVPVGDSWTTIVPILHDAIHGHLSWSELWAPKKDDGRLPVSYLVVVAAGELTHYNTRAIILLAGLLLWVSFAMLIVLLRVTWAQRVTAPMVFVLALVWFSLGGIDNALWSFQIQLYLVIFFFIAMLLLLHLSETDQRVVRRVALLGAIACAVAASWSNIAGFLLWPCGLIVMIWHPERIRGSLRRLGLWIGSGLAITIATFAGYNVGTAGEAWCGNASCGVADQLHHPLNMIEYLVTLIGNYAPVSDTTLATLGAAHTHRHEALGVAILIASCIVVIQSWRHRTKTPASWLPAILIIFGVAWDLAVTLGRSERGLLRALASHYVTPQPIIVTGILIGVFQLVRMLRSPAARTQSPAFTVTSWAAVGAVGVVVVALTIISTGVGRNDAQVDQQREALSVGVLTNLDEVPAQDRGCVVNDLVFLNLATPSMALSELRTPIADLKEDHLSLFRSAASRAGDHIPPKVPGCTAPF